MKTIKISLYNRPVASAALHTITLLVLKISVLQVKFAFLSVKVLKQLKNSASCSASWTLNLYLPVSLETLIELSPAFFIHTMGIWCRSKWASSTWITIKCDLWIYWTREIPFFWSISGSWFLEGLRLQFWLCLNNWRL